MAKTRRVTCDHCNGTGGFTKHFDYARGKSMGEFCEWCNGYGYRVIPAAPEAAS